MRLFAFIYAEPTNNTEENSSTTQPNDSQEVKVESDNQSDIESNTRVSDIKTLSEDSHSDSKPSQNLQSVLQSEDRTEKTLEVQREGATVDPKCSEDNQVIVSSPEVSKPRSELKTSTPQAEEGRSRERHDSRLSIEEEEAEFEEDKIMGKCRERGLLILLISLFGLSFCLFYCINMFIRLLFCE